MGFGSPMHWLVIGIVALLLFGNRLPEVARSLGRALNEFKRGLKEVGDPTKDSDDDDDVRGRLDPPGDGGPDRRVEHDEQRGDYPRDEANAEAERNRWHEEGR
jgi:TatA/E family protein of Tat protein translocase